MGGKESDFRQVQARVRQFIAGQVDGRRLERKMMARLFNQGGVVVYDAAGEIVAVGSEAEVAGIPGDRIVVVGRKGTSKDKGGDKPPGMVEKGYKAGRGRVRTRMQQLVGRVDDIGLHQTEAEVSVSKEVKPQAMRVVLDANVVFAGLGLSGGTSIQTQQCCKEILGLIAEGRLEWCITERIAGEIAGVGLGLGLDSDTLAQWLDRAREVGGDRYVWVDEFEVDPTDTKYVEALLRSGGDYLISCDRHLLEDVPYRYRAIHPKNFLALPQVIKLTEVGLGE